MIENDSKQYRDNINRNYLKWDNLANTPKFTTDPNETTSKARTFTAAVKFLNKWLEARVEFLNNEWHK